MAEFGTPGFEEVARPEFDADEVFTAGEFLAYFRETGDLATELTVLGALAEIRAWRQRRTGADSSPNDTV